MEFKDCYQFANEVHDCYLATCDGDQPRVRALGMWFADETGFYFQTQTVKALYKQIERNPKVEICFHSKDSGKLMRVYGEAKIITDTAIRTRCIEERPLVKNFGIETPDNPLLGVFQVYQGEAYFWTGADSMKEADIPRIKFG